MIVWDVNVIKKRWCKHRTASRVGGPPDLGGALESVVCVLCLSQLANGKCILNLFPSVFVRFHSVLARNLP
ncbi:hypothetical protein JHK82_048926 [Glycine max]|uniref:Uncharacterized protein n=2 Tax=Glycine subgen. Soja TaxID=1462606 RepID=A0A0R0FUH2_SOYBN|nr:hypothetical protein JHK86_048779 [Glycine max]KAG4934563.1 hypothetical protein JHK87_048565 [Glycine soja]KAG4944780.1 hypothetical protein JHK85_049426 [Glycine max]KAG5099072.1 hypothetical protein JHK82_048926 [Glycine max]KAG5103842.1 hypothetical protein JHK84_048811 [Glycine max]